MTAFQLALLAGAVVGLGLGILVWGLAPGRITLSDALARVSGDDGLPVGTLETAGRSGDLTDRLGLWLLRHASLRGVPEAELNLLQLPVHRFLAQRVQFALVGLLMPTVVGVLAWLLGTGVPVVLPVGAALLLAIALSFIPVLNARTLARQAKDQFSRELSSYMDLVALERVAGQGIRHAMEGAAEVADSWVFRRIREELSRSRWRGQSSWEALTRLGNELDLPDLVDLANIMSTAGTQGAGSLESLRARADALRATNLSKDRAAANAINERLRMPMALLAVVFMLLLLVPGLLRIVS